VAKEAIDKHQARVIIPMHKGELKRKISNLL